MLTQEQVIGVVGVGFSIVYLIVLFVVMRGRKISTTEVEWNREHSPNPFWDIGS